MNGILNRKGEKRVDEHFGDRCERHGRHCLGK